MRGLLLALLLVSAVGTLGACKKEFEALPDTACPKIVAHTKALLGEGVKDKTDEEMEAVCMASTPKQRGCAMVAGSGADIMKCSLVRE